MTRVVLRNADLEVEIDPGRGADVLRLVDRQSALDVLFSTPWRQRADQICEGSLAVVSPDSQGQWLEHYRGGWQTLLPNAGPERVYNGAHHGYHGEASTVEWTVVSADETHVELTCELFTVPITVGRVVQLSGRKLTVTDALHNVADVDVRVDYVQHPAFGRRFLSGDVTIDTGGSRFVPEGDSADARLPGEETHQWPTYKRPDGCVRSLGVVPTDDTESTFGWLTDFSSHWASLTNHSEALTVRIEWDGEAMPYAWFWQELNHTREWPWYSRARVVAIEPSSTPTGGPDRESALLVAAGSTRSVWTSISLIREGPVNA